MITLTLLLIAAALAQEPRTIIYEFPEVEPVQGELLKPSASYLLPASVADARPCPARLSRLERQRRALERRRATADRTAALGDLDRCEARLTEVALWERWDAALAAGDAPPEEDADLAAIDALQRQAIARYDQALVSAELSQPDRVWMARGQAALGMRDEELAWASFQALLTQCPDSALAPMAHLQLGEQAFAEVQLDEAERHYRAITDGELTSFARYKLAWCRLNQGDEDGAKALFSELASGPDDDPLAVEARRDLTMLAATAEP
jgi:TolA-binding protein